ncbi:Spy/CpxP family protein refolding chaperone [Paludibacterium paludis]|uniref:Spy/CpxP family protein refolding chaperone n=1 Tax=Paludibacterium paludis TaxID=1225769 RepID=A0A918P2W6_9NEIS|nr:periplasmic heavy metal sensor [Paludibacterium paludis]GGY16930.1 hypothetical protein GCM10011289_20490 [Paludibacterium paludis]
MNFFSQRILRQLLVSSLCLAALPAAAAPCPGMMNPEPGMMAHGSVRGHPGLFGLLHRVDLSDAQKDTIFAILHEQAPTLRDAMKAMRNANRALKDLALSGKYDETRAAALADDIAAAHRRMALLHAATDARVVAVLTPSQRDRLKDLQTRHDMPH